jgi:hypothetical protein
MRTFKRYNGPFIAEASKLNRLMSVTHERFSELPGGAEESFEVHFSRGRIFETGAFDHVLALDNANNNQVTNLTIKCTNGPAIDDEKQHLIVVDLDATAPVDITLFVKSPDPKWAADTFAAAEEQIERLIQTNLLSRLKASSSLTALLSFMLLALLFMVGVLAIRERPNDVRMWLTTEDMRALSQDLTSPTVRPDLQSDVLRRQLKNMASRESDGFIPKKYRDWRIVVILLPVLASLGEPEQ